MIRKLALTKRDIVFGIMFIIFGILTVISLTDMLWVWNKILIYTPIVTLIFCVYCFFASAALLLVKRISVIVFDNRVVSSILILMILMLVIVRTTITPFWEKNIFMYFATESFFGETLFHFVNPLFMIVMYILIKQNNIRYFNCIYVIFLPLIYAYYSVICYLTNGIRIYIIFDAEYYPNIAVYILAFLGITVALVGLAIMFIFIKKKQSKKSRVIVT